MSAEDELNGADYAEHGIKSLMPEALEAIGNPQMNGRSTESQISLRNQSQSDNKMAGIYNRTLFNDDPEKPPARTNPAFIPDESV